MNQFIINGRIKSDKYHLACPCRGVSHVYRRRDADDDDDGGGGVHCGLARHRNRSLCALLSYFRRARFRHYTSAVFLWRPVFYRCRLIALSDTLIFHGSRDHQNIQWLNVNIKELTYLSIKFSTVREKFCRLPTNRRIS